MWVCECVGVCVCACAHAHMHTIVCVVWNGRGFFFSINLQSCTLHIFIHPDLIGIIINIKYWLKESNLLILNMLRISSLKNKLLGKQFFCYQVYLNYFYIDSCHKAKQSINFSSYPMLFILLEYQKLNKGGKRKNVNNWQFHHEISNWMKQKKIWKTFSSVRIK